MSEYDNSAVIRSKVDNELTNHQPHGIKSWKMARILGFPKRNVEKALKSLQKDGFAKKLDSGHWC